MSIGVLGKDIYYQKIPTFRVHQPGNLAVAAYHKDSEYSHSTKELNFFLPLTDAFGSNTIWVESEEGKGDYSPMDAKYGEAILWNGANLMHGNKTNDTGLSRVSVDFRVIKKSDYEDEGKISVTNNTKMTIGDYWV